MKRVVAFFLTFLLLFVSAGVPIAYADNGGVTVHYTDTGYCYHREGCTYLRSDHICSLSVAVNSKHLSPCSRCRPAVLGENRASDTLTYQEYSAYQKASIPQSGSSSSEGNGEQVDLPAGAQNLEQKPASGWITVVGLVFGGLFGVATLGSIAGIVITNLQIVRERRKNK